MKILSNSMMVKQPGLSVFEVYEIKNQTEIKGGADIIVIEDLSST